MILRISSCSRKNSVCMTWTTQAVSQCNKYDLNEKLIPERKIDKIISFEPYKFKRINFFKLIFFAFVEIWRYPMIRRQILIYWSNLVFKLIWFRRSFDLVLIFYSNPISHAVPEIFFSSNYENYTSNSFTTLLKSKNSKFCYDAYFTP